jgi:hypothetical protein
MQITAAFVSLVLIAGSFVGLGGFLCRLADERRAERVRLHNEKRRREIYATTGLLIPVDTPFKWR